MAQGVLRRVWRVARWPLGAILILYIGLVIYRIPAVDEKMRTEEAVAKIHAQRLTLDDVTGKNLPPAPDPDLADATVEGVDANENGIRDDVELAIFKKYPNDAKIRAAELQYAMALQMELTKVFSPGTFVATLQEAGRANLCIASTAPVLENEDEAYKLADQRRLEVKTLVFNTVERDTKYEQNFQFNTSYGDLDDEPCDIDTSKLQ